ncbi:histidine kinase [Blastopirellula marina]|uniref:Histidine kinase n=1 Tax=Blastopirellula marina TaxID=124 RepID=A0A2S8F2K4_9BACT|nr:MULTISPECIES: PA2169 family four-helix-bundle protein [Pirellulaceae]PQO26405.1 histidine kinase [Blastopirellula marina]RCS44861.1 PA2169 family four-helix-bundle protein [Bremerella cremea]
MTLETKTKLSPETLSIVQELIKINVDSRDTFQELADATGNASVAIMFRELASERNRNVAELESLMSINRAKADESASVAATYHRIVIGLRSALGAGTATMLDEAETAEEKIQQKYEELLKREPGSAVSDILHRQYGTIRAAHERVRAIRDAHRRAT